MDDPIFGHRANPVVAADAGMACRCLGVVIGPARPHGTFDRRKKKLI